MAKVYKIPYNKTFTAENSLREIELLLEQNHPLDGCGFYSQKCEEFLQNKYGIKKVLLTTSCTAALEMGVLLADIKPGDEVIMPSYTFVSTANAVVLKGGIPVFVDINPFDFNIDYRQIEKAVTPKTKAVIPVHYAGNSCDMTPILQIAQKHNLFIIEDAAQGIHSFYKGRALGSIGDIGAVSFHYTKNIQSGEGGALYINNENLIDRAEIILEKGTNRKQFKDGRIDKYTWVDIGSSYCPSEITAAFLYANLQHIDDITQKRLRITKIYQQFFEPYEKQGILKTPHPLSSSQANAHIYFVLMNSPEKRKHLLQHLNNHNIAAQTHFVPLHSAPYAKLCTRTFSELNITTLAADQSLRLPVYDMTDGEINYVLGILAQYFKDVYNV